MPKPEKNGQTIKLTSIYAEVYCTREDCARFTTSGASCRLMRGEVDENEDGSYDAVSVTVWCDYFTPKKPDGEANEKGD